MRGTRFLGVTLILGTIGAGAGLAVPCSRLPGQAPSSTPLAQAQALAQSGDSARARAIVDSILADTDPDALPYADALYWRGTLAGSAEGRRKDLLRVVVEYPFSSHVSAALFRLAQTEKVSGNRDAAERHLDRLVRDYAGSEFGSQAAFELGTMLMVDGSTRPACAAFDSALAHEAPDNVERRNQITYAKRPCERLAEASRDTTAGPADTTQPRSGRGSGRGQGVTPKAGPSAGRGTAAPENGRWSVQVAAFSIRTDAAALAARLKARGYDSRVTTDKPFRVRVGRFATRTAANAVVEKLKAEKNAAIIVEAERP